MTGKGPLKHQPNPTAEMILDELRQAKTPEECEAISEKYAAEFDRLRREDPPRAIHIVNLAKVKRMRMQQEQQDLWA